jgi:hypothetical protein
VSATPGAALTRLTEVLSGLGIPFLIGGSLASSIHGIPRTTLDVDLVVELLPRHAEPLAGRLRPEFYTDADMIARALETGRAFNLIHIASGYRFGLFPLSSDAFPQSEFARRRVEATSPFGAPLQLPVATPEDTVLAKLKWFQAGHEVSERQWNDVRGVLEVQKGRLDLEYVRHWACHLRIEEMLDRALREAGL